MKVKFLKKWNEANEGDIAEIEDVVTAKGLIAAGMAQEYKEEPQRVVADVDAKAISDAVSKGISDILAARKEENKSDDEQVKKYKSLGALCKDIRAGKVKNVNIGTDAQGGYATTEYVDPAVDVDVLASSGVASRATRITLTGTNNVYKTNTITSFGTAPAVVAEGVATTDSQPVIAQVALTLKKYTYMYYATQEALEDTGALTSEINAGVNEEFAKVVENGMLNGDTLMTGIVGHAQTASIAKETGQTAATIVAANIDKMFSAAKTPGRSVWVMSRSAYAAVQGLEDSEGQRIFQGPNGIKEAPFGTLKGLPILVSDYCQAVGTVGDIVLGDFSKYKIAQKAGLQVDESKHIKFDEAETAFRFILRAAGAPVGRKLTATDSSVVADFLTLAERA